MEQNEIAESNDPLWKASRRLLEIQKILVECGPKDDNILRALSDEIKKILAELPPRSREN